MKLKIFLLSMAVLMAILSISFESSEFNLDWFKKAINLSDNCFEVDGKCAEWEGLVRKWPNLTLNELRLLDEVAKEVCPDGFSVPRQRQLTKEEVKAILIGDCELKNL